MAEKAKPENKKPLTDEQSAEVAGGVRMEETKFDGDESSLETNAAVLRAIGKIDDLGKDSVLL